MFVIFYLRICLLHFYRNATHTVRDMKERVVMWFKKRKLHWLLIAITGVNFINILHARFLYNRKLRSFFLIAVWLCDFWQKDVDTKAARKMLMKLTPDDYKIS